MTASHRASSKKKGFVYLLKKFKFYYFLMSVGLLYFLIYKYVPMAGVLIAFKKISPFMTVSQMISAPWVGFKNFTTFFNSYYFKQTLGNTLIISSYNIVFGFPAPIILALLVNEVRSGRYKKTVQTISYLPHFLSVVIVTGMLRNLISVDGGFVNQIAMMFGAKEPIYFLGSNKYIRGLIVGSGIWQGVGWGSIIYLAAIMGVDQELYEAAIIDGANRFRLAWHITLPGIMFTISIMFIMQCGGILDAGFERVMLLYSHITYKNADIIDTYVYRTGIGELQYSYSAAVGLFKSVFALGMVSSVNWIAKKMGQVGIW